MCNRREGDFFPATKSAPPFGPHCVFTRFGAGCGGVWAGRKLFYSSIAIRRKSLPGKGLASPPRLRQETAFGPSGGDFFLVKTSSVR